MEIECKPDGPCVCSGMALGTDEETCEHCSRCGCQEAHHRLAIVYTCSKCGAHDVELLMPVWCVAETLVPVDVDYEAEPLSTWCKVCEDHAPLVQYGPGETRTITGRWDSK